MAMKSPKKIALLGFDCALTSLVRKHIDEGIAPNFKKVFEGGTVSENCLVPYPTITPPNWTVMATGAWPGTNNVTDFWRQIPGLTPSGENTHNSFNWDYVASESFWEAADKIGKKSVILNYPMSYNVHKKLKNAVVVGGAGLTPGVYYDGYMSAQIRGVDRKFIGGSKQFAFCGDVVISTEIYPGNAVRVSLSDAKGWINVPDMGDNPLECEMTVPMADSLFNVGTTYVKWYMLIRDFGKGYEEVTLAPEKDFSKAFFSLKVNQWSKPFEFEGPLEKGGAKTVRMMARLMNLDEDGDSVTLYLTHGINTDGDLWCYPKEKAALLNKGENVPTNSEGFGNLSTGWYGLDEWMEQIGIHYDWMGDTATALLKDGDWDIFYCHAHPTDHIYHAIMTDLDPDTCSSKEAYEHAWELHRQLYRYADRYLGRLLELMDDDTLVLLVSDHGATPDGPLVNTMEVLEQAGLAAMLPYPPEIAAKMATYPENLRPTFRALYDKMDSAKCKAIPSRMCYVYVNLKGRDPEGIVEPEDYEKVQREIIDAMMSYRHPATGKCPFIMAIPKREAMMLGLWGDQVGDVVYAVWPEYSMQHGCILPGSKFGIGDLRTLCVWYGPKIGIKQGYSMERHCNIVDLVPTFCYLTGWPLPKDTEGAVVYQIMEDMNWRP